jgi:hypothetical protein
MQPSATATYLLRHEDFVDHTIADGPLQHILSGSRNVGPLFRRVYRSGSSGDWRQFLTDDDLIVMNRTCEAYLRRFNYPLARETTKEKPSRRAGSDYVANVIAEACASYNESTKSASPP